MTYKFFKDVTTIEELRKQFKALAFRYHPDRGGNEEDMKAINAEYQALYERVKFTHQKADGSTYTKKEETETPDEFREIINAIINFNVDIELCGSWLWVFNAYAYKEQLKALNFFYCAHKRAWAFTFDKPKKNKHKLTMDEIRNAYGSEKIKESKENEKITGAA